MTVQTIIRLDEKTKKKLTKLAKAEGKNNSQVIRELIQNYIEERDMESYIDDLWNRMRQNFKEKKITQKDIERAIREVRAKKNESSN